MNSLTDLQTLLHSLCEPITPASASDHAERFPILEAELRRTLGDEHTPQSTLDWLDTQRPPHFSAARLAFQWAMAWAGTDPEDVSAPDAYLGFCPVTVVMTSRLASLPSLTPAFFDLPIAELLITLINDHGLADDAGISMGTPLYPLPMMARLRASQLPRLSRALARALARPCAEARIPRRTDANCPPQNSAAIDATAANPPAAALDVTSDDLMQTLTVAGDRIIGSFLLPIVFEAMHLPRPPKALTGELGDEAMKACATALSRTGTLAMDGRSGLGIETHIGYPRLLWDALEEAVTSHAALATYWTARLAVRKGLTVGALAYAAGPDGHDLAIGFQVGGRIENNLQVIAGTQHEVDGYTDTLMKAARDAGLTRIHHRIDAPDHCRDTRPTGIPTTGRSTGASSFSRKA